MAANGCKNRPHDAYLVRCRVPAYYEPSSQRLRVCQLKTQGNLKKFSIGVCRTARHGDRESGTPPPRRLHAVLPRGAFETPLHQYLRLGFGVWFGVWGLGIGDWGLGFGVWGMGFGGYSFEGGGLGLRGWVCGVGCTGLHGY